MRPLRAFLCFCVPAVLLSAPASSAELEKNVKAAYLYKFLSYVEWPATEPAVGSPLVIGVLNADDVYASLLPIVQGRQAQGHPVQVRTIKAGEAISGVHLLFVGRAASSELTRLAGQPGVLIVSEIEGGLEQGAMINLLRVGDRVRFEVAPGIAERGGLRISSRMLTVALRVKGERP